PASKRATDNSPYARNAGIGVVGWSCSTVNATGAILSRIMKRNGVSAMTRLAQTGMATGKACTFAHRQILPRNRHKAKKVVRHGTLDGRSYKDDPKSEGRRVLQTNCSTTGEPLAQARGDSGNLTPHPTCGTVCRARPGRGGQSTPDGAHC